MSIVDQILKADELKHFQVSAFCYLYNKKFHFKIAAYSYNDAVNIASCMDVNAVVLEIDKMDSNVIANNELCEYWMGRSIGKPNGIEKFIVE